MNEFEYFKNLMDVIFSISKLSIIDKTVSVI